MIWRVPYPKFGNGVGLDRIRKIASVLNLDLAGFSADGAVVTGSNGKGSTAAMCAAILGGAPRVGLFTSPHLFALNERFRIGGEDISDSQLALHWERVVAAAEAAGEAHNLGGFEFLFLIAADWFAARSCTHTIWEAGIGGRYDPVRLIEARRVALTSLDLEHTALLGDTLEDIARDKLDAAPAGAIVFVGASCEPQRAAIEAHGAARGVRIVFAGEADAPLPGAHQRQNAALAIALARDISNDLSADDIATGLASARWPGRLETISRDPLVIIDVGHTPAGVHAALEGFALLSAGKPGVLVCGVSADKAADAIVAPLARRFSYIYCAAAGHKGLPAAEVAAIARAANPRGEIEIAGSVSEAYARALSRARASGEAVYVAGGLFLAAEFKAVHMGRDPASLAFF